MSKLFLNQTLDHFEFAHRAGPSAILLRDDCNSPLI